MHVNISPYLKRIFIHYLVKYLWSKNCNVQELSKLQSKTHWLTLLKNNRI